MHPFIWLHYIPKLDMLVISIFNSIYIYIHITIHINIYIYIKLYITIYRGRTNQTNQTYANFNEEPLIYWAWSATRDFFHLPSWECGEISS